MPFENSPLNKSDRQSPSKPTLDYGNSEEAPLPETDIQLTPEGIRQLQRTHGKQYVTKMITRLQRTYGNQHVMRMLSSPSTHDSNNQEEDSHRQQEIINRSNQEIQSNAIQRFLPKKPVPSMEEQASIMAGGKDNNSEIITADFFKKIVETAETSILSKPEYEDLKEPLKKVTINSQQIKDEDGHNQFWRELMINSDFKIGNTIAQLRALSRLSVLEKFSEGSIITNIPSTTSAVKDNFLNGIMNEDILIPLFKSQFEVMVNQNAYTIIDGLELNFIGHLLQKSDGQVKIELRKIVSENTTNKEKVFKIRTNKLFKDLIKKESIDLLSNSIIAPPSHGEIYTLLHKNGTKEQVAALNRIYNALEDYGDKAESQILKKLAGFNLVKEFLKRKNDVDILEVDFMKAGMKDRLMKTLFVGRLLDPKMAERYPVEKEIFGEWKDGGNLADNLSFEFENENKKNYTAQFEESEVREKFMRADKIIKELVSKSVLSKIKRPAVIADKSHGHRAYQQSDHISVSVFDPVDVIVHEIGHYIEMNNPELWFDVSLLLHSRHQKPKGPNALSGEIGKQESNPSAKGRFQGEYPATGDYTSKIYERSGATEVTSETMEFLSDPKKARELIEKDPFQAILVLRRIQPDDSQLQQIYEYYKEDLPFHDPVERKRLLRRISELKNDLVEINLVGHFQHELEHLDTMGIPSLRLLEDHMESLPTSYRIMDLIEKHPKLMETFSDELDAAMTYTIHKLNQLLLKMEVASFSLKQEQ